MKIGIITMHRVPNCGSALQAYALQRFLDDMGHQVELIDYVYPNSYHKEIAKGRAKKKFPNIILRIMYYAYSRFTSYCTMKRFTPFYRKFFKLSQKTYHSKEEIALNPPSYDVYISGSDQIWNPTYIGEDTTFMLSFVQKGKRISYSSSIANRNIPVEYSELYSDALKRIDAISVREELSCQLVKSMTGKEVYFVLDPTLLLNAEQWADVVNTANIAIKEDYILVYILGYSFDVNDYAAKVINHLQDLTGMKVVLLAYSKKKRGLLNDYVSINDMKPENFLSLIKNAAIMVTDSFHATAMSINFSRPLYSLIKDKKSSDNRVYSFLQSLGAEKRAVEKDTSLDELPEIKMDYTVINIVLERERLKAVSYLERNISVD